MDASDLEKLIRDLGFSKIRIVNSHNDTNIMFCCPWHGESNPSAGISANKEYGACYACGQGFTLLSLVAYMKDMSLRKARDYLEERYNVKKKTTGKKVRKIKRYGEPDELDEGDESREINNATLPYYRLAPYKSGKSAMIIYSTEDSARRHAELLKLDGMPIEVELQSQYLILKSSY